MMAGAVVTTSVADQGGLQNVQMRRGVPPGAGLTTDDFAWPEELPLLRYDGTRVTPWGDAWVARMLPHGVTPRIEVFDDAGTWIGYIPVPEGSTLVGFGHTGDGGAAAYLVRSDDVELKWLSRYRVRREGEGG